MTPMQNVRRPSAPRTTCRGSICCDPCSRPARVYATLGIFVRCCSEAPWCSDRAVHCGWVGCAAVVDVDVVAVVVVVVVAVVVVVVVVVVGC